MRRAPEQLCSLVGYYKPAVSTVKRANSTGERDWTSMTAASRTSMSMARAHNKDLPLLMLIKTGSQRVVFGAFGFGCPLAVDAV